MATVLQRLATLGIDAVTSTVVSDQFVIIHRDPEPTEEMVSRDGTIYLRVVDLNGTPATPSTVQFLVYVDQGAGWVQAFDNTSILSPFDGARALIGQSTGASPYCYREVKLDQMPTLFPSDGIVNIRVDLIVAAGGFGHFPFGHVPFGHSSGTPTVESHPYEFRAADETPPNVTAAQAIARDVVRVTFDDAMALEDPGSVLPPTMWTFERVTDGITAIAEITAVGVELADSTEAVFDVTVDIPMTPGAPYRVVVDTSARDDASNLIAINAALFAGFSPEVPADRYFDFWSLMMPLKNREEDATRDLKRLCNCVQEVLDVVMYDIDHFTDQFDPDFATDEQISLMLYDMGNPFEWTDLDLSENQRRKLLRLLVDIYKTKGTPSGIEDAIFLLLGIPCQVVSYSAVGWRLGIDALGEGLFAVVRSSLAEVFDMSTAPLTLLVSIDEGAEQTLTFNLADFATPSAALSSEIAAVVNSQLAGGTSYIDRGGMPARLVGLVSEPYAISPGDVLTLEVNGVELDVVFHASDFALAGAATAAEVAARIAEDIDDVEASGDGAVVTITTKLEGADSSLLATGALVATLGLPVAQQNGNDLARINIRSNKYGTDASVEITGGTAQGILGFFVDAASGTGGSILAPGTSFQLYSFDLEILSPVTADEEILMRRIANYMKPAHTHLVNVREAPTAEPSPYWLLGIDVLDSGTVLAP